MSNNKSNNLYSLEAERKRLEQIRKQRKKDQPASPKAPWKNKVALYGQVVFFLVMVGLLMYQCGGH